MALVVDGKKLYPAEALGRNGLQIEAHLTTLSGFYGLSLLVAPGRVTLGGL